MHKNEIINREMVQDALYTKDEDIIISKSPFSAFEEIESEELVYRGIQSYANSEKIAMQIHLNILKVKDDDTIDLEILKALHELEFAISRMITIYLNIKGIEIHQKKVSKRLRYMNNLGVISSYELISKDKNGNINRYETPIYFLDKASTFILKSQGINARYSLENALKPKDSIKEMLARNQLMLRYVTNVTNIEYTKNRPIYKLPNNDSYLPQLQIVFTHKNKKQHILFEFVRSYKDWQLKLISRLDKCKTAFDNFAPSAAIPTIPLIVLVAEDDRHALDIMKVIVTNELTMENSSYLFTTDNRTRTLPLNQSIFRFGVEDNKPVIKTLSIELLNLVKTS